MALTSNGSRLITADETLGRSRMRRRPTSTQECQGGPLIFALNCAGAAFVTGRLVERPGDVAA